MTASQEKTSASPKKKQDDKTRVIIAFLFIIHLLPDSVTIFGKHLLRLFVT